MNQLLGPDTFEFLARYFLAGWIFLAVRSWWVRGERPKPNEVVFEAITLSLINQLISLVTVPFIYAHLADPPSTIHLIAEVVAQPALIGLAVGWLANNNILPDGLRRLFMPTIQPVADAFKFAFDQIDGPSYVILSFSDGRSVFGFFGPKSLSSGTGREGGIYLESIYVLDSDDNWIEARPSRGSWVSLQDLTSIEFLEAQEF